MLKKSGLALTGHFQTSIYQMDHFVQLQRRKMEKELKIEWNVPKHTALFTICISPGILRETISKLFKKSAFFFTIVKKAVNIFYNSLMEKCAKVFL